MCSTFSSHCVVDFDVRSKQSTYLQHCSPNVYKEKKQRRLILFPIKGTHTHTGETWEIRCFCSLVVWMTVPYVGTSSPLSLRTTTTTTTTTTNITELLTRAKHRHDKIPALFKFLRITETKCHLPGSIKEASPEWLRVYNYRRFSGYLNAKHRCTRRNLRPSGCDDSTVVFVRYRVEQSDHRLS